MKKLGIFALTVVFALLGSTVALSQTPDLNGTWTIVLNSPEGSHPGQAQIKAEGGKLTGTIKGDFGELPLQGSFSGKEVKLNFTVKYQGADLPINLTGAFEGNDLKGKANFGGMAEGDWTGKLVAGAKTGTPAGGSDAAGNVTGTWALRIESENVNAEPTLILKQEGEKLTGTYKGRFGDSPVNGTVKGSDVNFSVKVSPQGQEIEIKFTGVLNQASLKGTVQFGEFGSGNWTGTRK